MSSNYELLAKRTRYFVLSSYFGLLFIFTMNTLVLPSCNKSSSPKIWLIHLLPMLLFLPGLLKCNVRTHVWLSFISLGYFIAAVPVITACFSVLPVIETLLIVQLFISAMFYIRWRSKELAIINSLQAE